VVEDVHLIFLDSTVLMQQKFNICVNQMVVLLYFSPPGYFWLSYVNVKENVGPYSF